MNSKQIGGLGLALCASLLSGAAFAETRVNSIFADRVNHVLYVDGAEFTSGLLIGEVPYVEFTAPRLPLTSSSNPHLEATLPTTLADGEYSVFISKVSSLLSGVQAVA